MNIPKNLRYTKDHEWAKADGTLVTVGITEFAQDSLGDVVFVELPKVGSTIEKGKQFGVVESVKAVSDLFAPLSGTVTEINTTIIEEPELINKDPYEKAWMIKVEAKDMNELEKLMNSNDYATMLKEHQ